MTILWRRRELNPRFVPTVNCFSTEVSGMTRLLRVGTPVTVQVYGIPQTGVITQDQPLALHRQQGRTIPVRLNSGQLRFFARQDVNPR